MITIPILSVCFLAALSCKIKKAKAPVLRLLLWYLHLVFAAFALLCLLLMINNYGFKGTQTERVFFTLYAGTGMLLYGLTKPGNDARYAYLLCLFGFPLLLFLGLLLPPLRIITLVAGITLLCDSNFHRYPIDDDYALQTKSNGILSAWPDYSLVEDKYFLFEKITPDIIKPRDEVHFIRMAKTNADSVRIQVNRVDTTIRIGN
ncbi:hypothetical protein [Chitinophaga sp. 212800010-3]|uniref:hypothetical protein n=1 Tax=unclassified Chitinophaga TaxID=2619133 RepID=UPI002DED772B|nr:CcmF-C domain-containing protein [Chitinophaga sp. 212800010-3]